MYNLTVVYVSNSYNPFLLPIFEFPRCFVLFVDFLLACYCSRSIIRNDLKKRAEKHKNAEGKRSRRRRPFQRHCVLIRTGWLARGLETIVRVLWEARPIVGGQLVATLYNRELWHRVTSSGSERTLHACFTSSQFEAFYTTVSSGYVHMLNFKP